MNTNNLPVAKSVKNTYYGRNDDFEILPVAATLESNHDDTTKLLDQVDGKKNDSKTSYEYNVSSASRGQQASSSSSYWGRFEDPVVTSVTVLSGAVDDNLPVASAELDNRKMRHLFIRKVYMILTAQLFVTFGSCAVITLYTPARVFVLGSGLPLYWFNVIVMFCLVCALSVHKRNHPTNVILLSFFTLSCSYLVGTVTAMYAENGAGDLVLEAVAITASVFIILTVFTLQSKIDFSFMGAGLGMGLWILILWGFFGMIFGLQTGMVYAMGGSVLFSGFIIYDTYMLCERHDPRDYVIAAVELYLDIINLFLYILQLLGESNRR